MYLFLTAHFLPFAPGTPIRRCGGELLTNRQENPYILEEKRPPDAVAPDGQLFIYGKSAGATATCRLAERGRVRISPFFLSTTLLVLLSLGSSLHLFLRTV